MNHLSGLRVAAGRSKSIDDPLLNRLGIQPARTMAARARLGLRRWPRPVDPEVRAWLTTLEADGCLMVEDFLAADDLAAVRDAALACIDDPEHPRDVLGQGANTLEVIWRTDMAECHRSAADLFFADPRLRTLLSGAAKVHLSVGAGRCVLMRLTQKSGDADLESAIHTDTFHPTHKAWIYLDDVSEADGPLIYYPESHRIDSARLRAVYREATSTNEGSRRIGAREIASRRVARRVFTCQANTLVVADTAGYHGRLQGSPPGVRLALEIELRPDPFRRPDRMPEDRARATSAHPETGPGADG